MINCTNCGKDVTHKSVFRSLDEIHCAECNERVKNKVHENILISALVQIKLMRYEPNLNETIEERMKVERNFYQHMQYLAAKALDRYWEANMIK